jgi:hypothetical protein
MVADFDFMHSKRTSPAPVLMMVDLKNIPIADKTNLPARVKQPQKKPTPVASSQPQNTLKTQAPSTPVPPTKPKEVTPPKEAVTVKEPPKPKEPPKKTPVQRPDKNTAPQSGDKSGSNLKSLLASVDKIRKPVTPGMDGGVAVLTGQEVTDGIEGGSGGSLTQMLSISESDFIANKLRGCWNIDAGAEGIDDIVVEVRAYVNRDGRVRDVKILNSKNTPAYRSVAESAKRAVLICDNMGEESPFQILADKYGENYASWKEIFLRFSPLDGVY